jgi:hypothetical protein
MMALPFSAFVSLLSHPIHPPPPKFTRGAVRGRRGKARMGSAESRSVKESIRE